MGVLLVRTEEIGADISTISRLFQECAIQPTSTDQSGWPKKLKGFTFAFYRLRAGNYRVLYRIDARLVTIMRVVNRKDLEKIAKRLKLS